MRNLIFFICSVAWAQYVPVPFTPIPPPAGISFVAAVQNSTGCTGATITTPSLNVQSGDDLIIGIAVNSSIDRITAPTTNDSETATIIGSHLQNAFGGDYWDATYAVLNASADSAKTVTETLTSGAACGIVVYQFRGSSSHTIDVSSAVNSGNFSTGGASGICIPSTSSTATTCDSSFTPTVSGEAAVVFGSIFATNGNSFIAGNVCGSPASIPTNAHTSDLFINMAGEYLLNIGTSACTATFTYGSPPAFRAMGMAVTLKP